MELGIEYIPSNGGVFVLARLAPKALNFEDEAKAHGQYLCAGVLVIPGRAYSMPDGQAGWMRVTFALEREYLMKGLERIKNVYKEISQ
jgi:aspartate/methionine/tyrosine aminotransferase